MPERSQWLRDWKLKGLSASIGDDHTFHCEVPGTHFKNEVVVLGAAPGVTDSSAEEPKFDN